MQSTTVHPELHQAVLQGDHTRTKHSLHPHLEMFSLKLERNVDPSQTLFTPISKMLENFKVHSQT